MPPDERQQVPGTGVRNNVRVDPPGAKIAFVALYLPDFDALDSGAVRMDDLAHLHQIAVDRDAA
jgi:hypothetical protein